MFPLIWLLMCDISIYLQGQKLQHQLPFKRPIIVYLRGSSGWPFQISAVHYISQAQTGNYSVFWATLFHAKCHVWLQYRRSVTQQWNLWRALRFLIHILQLFFNWAQVLDSQCSTNCEYEKQEYTSEHLYKSVSDKQLSIHLSFSFN